MRVTISMTAALLMFGICGVSAPSKAETPPTRVGECTNTLVAAVETRLVDGDTGKPVLGSGTAIRFTNGVYLVSYETVPTAESSSRNDPFRLCLKQLPINCPPGDNRGKIYSATNLKTKKTFTLPDSEHSCGGA